MKWKRTMKWRNGIVETFNSVWEKELSNTKNWLDARNIILEENNLPNDSFDITEEMKKQCLSS